MRFMLRMSMPAEQGNAVIKDGSLGPTIQSILEELQPEAAYFTTVDGCRGGYIVLNMEDASQIPAVAEPFFLAFGATIEVDPVMSPEDLAKRLLDNDHLFSLAGLRG
jgi:hypothetical protein